MKDLFARLILGAYGSALRRIRPNAGLTVLSFNKITNRLFSFLPEKQTATTTAGLRIPVSINDYHGRILWLFGGNDFKVEGICQALTQPGDVFLDIGANHGAVGLAMFRKVGPQGEVHFFEPQPDLAAGIEQALRQEGGGRGHQHQVALSDDEAELVMSLSSRHSGLATIVGGEDGAYFDKTIRVKAVRTGPFIEALVGARPFGVKIDVEGAEPLILKSLLTFENIRFVQFEGVNNREELSALFAQAGFDVFGLERSAILRRVQHCARLSDWDAFHDFVALPARWNAPRERMSFDALGRFVRAPETRP